MRSPSLKILGVAAILALTSSSLLAQKPGGRPRNLGGAQGGQVAAGRNIGGARIQQPPAVRPGIAPVTRGQLPIDAIRRPDVGKPRPIDPPKVNQPPRINPFPHPKPPVLHPPVHPKPPVWTPPVVRPKPPVCTPPVVCPKPPVCTPPVICPPPVVCPPPVYCPPEPCHGGISVSIGVQVGCEPAPVIPIVEIAEEGQAFVEQLLPPGQYIFRRYGYIPETTETVIIPGRTQTRLDTRGRKVEIPCGPDTIETRIVPARTEVVDESVTLCENTLVRVLAR